MITPKLLQEAWIAYLKSVPAIIFPVPIVEVREHKWKGDIFTYPNIRVKVDTVIPDVNSVCSWATGNVTIQIFSEQKSSKEADTIAGNIATYLHGKKFTSSGVKFSAVIVESITGADSEDDLFWKAEISVRTLMS